VSEANIQLRKAHVCTAQRIVVKVGTNVLAEPGCAPDDARIGALADEISWLVEDGRQVVLVSSGAIGTGMAQLGITTRPTTLPRLQAVAGVGQSMLMEHYGRHFGRHGMHAAQVLLTRDDFDNHARYLNARNTLREMFNMKCVPIVNENDTISTDEICFGENDMLAALVTHMVEADLLVLLTSVPGIYVERPTADNSGQLLEVVRCGDSAHEHVFDGATPGGSGGMTTKIAAARTAAEAGEPAIIADGRTPGILRSIIDGAPVGTLFLPTADRLSSRKRWLRFTGRPLGTLTIDAGARTALVEGGKSLLPSGIVRAAGQFQPGDVVTVTDATGTEIARGLCNYSRADVDLISGKRTTEIAAILGHKAYDEVIHRDDLALV